MRKYGTLPFNFPGGKKTTDDIKILMNSSGIIARIYDGISVEK